jgi:acetyl esterase
MPLDPQIQALLDKGTGVPATHTLPVAVARAKYEARIAVGGDSAGGTMAAVTALRVRDEGGPGLCAQLLLYPVTDYHKPGTASYEENAEGYGLTRSGRMTFQQGIATARC